MLIVYIATVLGNFEAENWHSLHSLNKKINFRKDERREGYGNLNDVQNFHFMGRMLTMKWKAAFEIVLIKLLLNPCWRVLNDTMSRRIDRGSHIDLIYVLQVTDDPLFHPLSKLFIFSKYPNHNKIYNMPGESDIICYLGSNLTGNAN